MVKEKMIKRVFCDPDDLVWNLPCIHIPIYIYTHVYTRSYGT